MDRWRACRPSTGGSTRCRPTICARFYPRLTEWNQRHARLADLYDEALEGCAGARPIRRAAWPVNHLYVVPARRRERLREYLAKTVFASGGHVPLVELTSDHCHATLDCESGASGIKG